jgi:hypothetical protein
VYLVSHPLSQESEIAELDGLSIQWRYESRVSKNKEIKRVSKGKQKYCTKEKGPRWALLVLLTHDIVVKKVNVF